MRVFVSVCESVFVIHITCTRLNTNRQESQLKMVCPNRKCKLKTQSNRQNNLNNSQSNANVQWKHVIEFPIQ